MNGFGRICRPALTTLRAAILAAFLAIPTDAYAHEVDAPEVSSEGLKYEVDFSGVPSELNKDLPKYTDAIQQKKNPPPSLYLLERRLGKDVETLRKALQAGGYYDAVVSKTVDAESTPIKVVFAIEAGTRYSLVSLRVLPDETSNQNPSLKIPEHIKYELPTPLSYEEVITLGRTVRTQVFDANCLRSVEVKPLLRVDTTQKLAEAVYYVTAGEEARFGKLEITGLEKVKPAFVERKVAWKEGECYNPKATDTTQLSLLQSNLFARANITVAETPDEDGTVPVKLIMRERAQRTIKAGIGYASEEGFDFKPSWEHRNFFGEGEKLTIESTISTFLQELGATFERPAFMRDDQKLILKANISRSDTDAYTSNKIGGSGTIERQLTPNLLAGVGVGYSLSEVDDGISKEVYSLVSVPTYIEHSTRDNALDPTKGHVLRLDVEPLIETLSNGNVFMKTQGTAKFYHQHKNLPAKPTWAFRTTLGSIMGSAQGDIPPDERFFAGGGGSVRGYAYQILGPLSAAGEPEGGRSLAEFSGELRLRVTDTIGVVPFVDAGNVYNAIYPEFSDVSMAAGLGLRYFSGFGPFRFDFAVPLDKRDGVDDSYQFYLSFGQAF
ncbi:MAG: hypothetical protein FJX23_05025 [Alphaproteobacteria bacterium]|nr:hypothetical protein [Alphaproteobacteria bacterium]